MTDPAGAAASSRPSLQVVAGRYQVLRKIGSGGMGAVYLAKQIGVGNQVALKFLPAHLSDDAQLRRRFEREAALSLEVRHPGAAQLLDSGVDSDGQLYLAFEYVEGEDLSALLDREGALSFEDATALTCKVAEVLAFAHAKGVVHRDIKPENIRVRRDLAGLHVKVLDFGIARLVDEVGTKLTIDGGVAGTPRYMAPEQIAAGTIDARTDIYALGLVLFEAVTGREAFTRETTSQLMWAQLNDPVPAVVEVQPLRDYPALDAVIAQACAKEPVQRFASAQALVEAIKALQVPQWWGVPVPVVRRARANPSLSGGLNGGPPGGASQRDPVQLPRPGRKTFLQIRASAWVAMAVGGLALALAGAALWVALDQRKSAMPANGQRLPDGGMALPPGLAASTPTVTRPVPEPPDAVPAATRPAVQVSAAGSAPASAPVSPPKGSATAPAANTAPPVTLQMPAQSAAPAPDKGAAVPPVKSATTPAAEGEMPECTQLSVYDDSPLIRMTVAQLEQRVHAVKYMSPSTIANQLVTLKASADSFHRNSRECLYRAMLIRVVLNEKVVLASTPTLWGHSRDVPELERLFLEQPLRNDWTSAQRKDVLRQVETIFIANLQKDAPGDDVYWRRMYYGMLVACELTDEARAKVGAPRIGENSCLKIKPAGT
ncbi:serine/threonine-protein kinase [Rhodoferax mekongensis]|uniref:serine/threonine-protein kinase n=1 Tax=Rhodoferax mekongensis TaxID=3068341 RepID=UPI0028BF0B15|nr:serine/threonine-protein kinase [Rhodoferax sp. TBRC 17199]MDT7516098.1 serine/threonine-protein kinase [Rhodoferax sp. TBRC 17199]